MSDGGDICGWVTDDTGEPCKHPPSEDDGYCWQHTQTGEQRRGGRDEKLDEYADDLITAARAGMKMENIANLAGAKSRSLYRWLDKHDDFRRRFKRARAEGELTLIRDIEERGNQWLLERSFGYYRTEKQEVDADVTTRESTPETDDYRLVTDDDEIDIEDAPTDDTARPDT